MSGPVLSAFHRFFFLFVVKEYGAGFLLQTRKPRLIKVTYLSMAPRKLVQNSRVVSLETRITWVNKNSDHKMQKAQKREGGNAEKENKRQKGEERARVGREMGRPSLLSSLCSLDCHSRKPFPLPGHTVLKDVFSPSSKRIAVTGGTPSSSISHQQNDKVRIKYHQCQASSLETFNTTLTGDGSFTGEAL